MPLAVGEAAALGEAAITQVEEAACGVLILLVQAVPLGLLVVTMRSGLVAVAEVGLLITLHPLLEVLAGFLAVEAVGEVLVAPLMEVPVA